MNWRSRLTLFLLMFLSQAIYAGYRYRNAGPPIGDSAEVHNIAWNLAHGRGYSFDWNDAGWRSLWQRQNVNGKYDFILNRHGSYPTMFRPPLMPVLVAGILKVVPNYSFFAWRVFDAGAFAVAACFLCEVAVVHGGTAGLVTMIVILLADPLRRRYVPGWWTEGLAFDFVAILVWLLANGRPLRPWVYIATGGVTIGLLCLDRSVYVPLIPLLCLLMAIARPGAIAPRIGYALAILAVSVAVQLPWWVRNVELSGRMMPLGTQGGYNLPDEYGPAAIKWRGVWTAEGLCNALTPPGTPVPLPPGYTDQTFGSLWQFSPDRRYDAMIDRAVCRSLASEIEVAETGQKFAIDWVRSNYLLIPRLMLDKVYMQGRYARLPITGAVVIGCVGFLGLRAQRRMILLQAALALSYVLAIAITHAVYSRFLVPSLPPFYVLVMLGIVAGFRMFWGLPPVASPSTSAV